MSIQRYKILSTLGRGGFGETFLAEDLQMPSRRRCVIKLLKPTINTPRNFAFARERFAREAAVLEALGENHAQIPRLYAYFEENQQFYLVQEWVAGEPLNALLRDRGRFDKEEVVEILVGLLPVLDYMHAWGILHRDIKPSNIIIRTTDGLPVAIDFGAVKENLRSSEGPTIAIGTPGFMAPEQEIRRPTYASDIYSLGLTAICLLTGKYPQNLPSDRNSSKYLWQSFAPDIGLELTQILEKAIEPQLSNRFRCAKEMLVALEAISDRELQTPLFSEAWQPLENAFDSDRFATAILSLESGSLSRGFASVRIRLHNSGDRIPSTRWGTLTPAPQLWEAYCRWQLIYRRLSDLSSEPPEQKSAPAPVEMPTKAQSESASPSAEPEREERATFIQASAPAEEATYRQTNEPETESDPTRASQPSGATIRQESQANLSTSNRVLASHSRADLEAIALEFKTQLNEWLAGEEFSSIVQTLYRELDPARETRFIVQSADESVLQLPWHLWQFFQDYPRATLAFSNLLGQEFALAGTRDRDDHKACVLTIVGTLAEADIEREQQLLCGLPNSEVYVAVEPDKQQLERLLAEQEWQGLCFVSNPFRDGIELNPREYLSASELREILMTAQNLHFALISSGDGIALARNLRARYHPQLIVMRERATYSLTLTFLTFFLLAYSEGKSSFLAAREATEKLFALDNRFPGASWLPAILPEIEKRELSSPTLDPWPARTASQPIAPAPISATSLALKGVLNRLANWRQILEIAGISTVAIALIRLLGWLQPYELQAFDLLLRQRRPYETPDPRLLVVEVTSEDIANQAVPPQGRASLSEDTLTRLFAKLQTFEPAAIALDIYRDFPADSPQLAQLLQQENFFGICKVRDAAAGDELGVAPPPEIYGDRLTFSDVIADPDEVLRRHLLSQQSPDFTDPCTAKNHLSFVAALYYLNQQGIHWQSNPDGQLVLESASQRAVIRPLTTRTGGYQTIDARGRQILLNYRHLRSPQEIAPRLSVSDILQDRIPPQTLETLKHRLIFVGVVAPINASADYWLTPYSPELSLNQQKTPGVYLQAHMASQLLSATLDGRPLIWALPGGLDYIWIGGWSLVAAVSAGRSRTQQGAIFKTALVVAGLYGSCYVFILIGGWLPLVPGAIAAIASALSTLLFETDRPPSLDSNSSKNTDA